MKQDNIFNAIAIAVSAAMLVASPSGVRGGELCEQDPYQRKSMCGSVLNALSEASTLYTFTRDRAVFLPIWMYDFVDPVNVLQKPQTVINHPNHLEKLSMVHKMTDVSEFQSEISKYNAELDRLFQALERYTTTWVYLAWEQSNLKFKSLVETLRQRLRAARNTVDDLEDSLVTMLHSQPAAATSASKPEAKNTVSASKTAPTTAATTSTSTTAAPESVDSIQQKASFVSKKLRNLLRLWASRCSSCGDSRRRRSVFVSRMG
ncbi:hypothetical protein EGW08_020306 [Elysia chlorotica]|uniref:Uncharacterized protein n=1 Tax=Elysia chlorotica TaxID=188477 RepID=A0A433SRN7_ELYCH|nr:hypothetical protein EGW08_020306 [Elysia chlorotica]